MPMASTEKCPPLTRASVCSALELIRPHIHRTPVLTSTTLSDLASTPQTPEALLGTAYEGQTPARPKIRLFFKCENYQRIGAFKIRGAFHALARLSDEELSKGVVTHSSGNHAQALALAARTRGIPAYIVMPTISTPTKIAATKGYGASVIFSGSTSEEREAAVSAVKQRTGALLIPPYDHPNIILGQGTTALELEEQVQDMLAQNPGLSAHSQPPHPNPEKPNNRHSPHPNTEKPNGHPPPPAPAPRPPTTLDAVIAPCGGGGLLSGLATALAPTRTLVFGAEPSFQAADDCRLGLSLSPPTRITSVRSLTIADGLRTPVGEVPWSVICDREKVEGVYAVSEGQIVRALRLVLERLKVWVEPSAVLGVAVVLWDEGFRRVVERKGGGEGWDVGVVLSGGNMSVEAVGRMSAGGEGAGERAEGKVGVDGGREVENVAG